MSETSNIARAGLIALVGSGSLLGGALGFQYLADLPPCALCIEQRYPHVVAMLAGAIAIFNTPLGKPSAFVAALALAITGIMGAHHAGIEYGFWAGPQSCTGVDINAALDDLMNRSPILCDEIPWSLFGISLAGYNAIFSLGLSALTAREALKHG